MSGSRHFLRWSFSWVGRCTCAGLQLYTGTCKYFWIKYKYFYAYRLSTSLHSWYLTTLQSWRVSASQWVVFFTSQLKVLVIWVAVSGSGWWYLARISMLSTSAYLHTGICSVVTRSPACPCTWSRARWSSHPWAPAYTPARSPAHTPPSPPTPGQARRVRIENI